MSSKDLILSHNKQSGLRFPVRRIMGELTDPDWLSHHCVLGDFVCEIPFLLGKSVNLLVRFSVPYASLV